MLFEKIVDNNSAGSLATRLRKKRFKIFLMLLSGLNRPISILDVGGTERFWQLMGLSNNLEFNITILNVNEYDVSSPNINSLSGDARDIKFPDSIFDVVFSNSVIEHVGVFEDQIRMAEEIRRVGKRYFVQTPNRNFIIEPHFLFPYFQFLPIRIQMWLVMNFKMGWFERETSAKRALNLVESITLLNKYEILTLFPESNLYKEKLFGITKSFIVYSGWDLGDS